MKRSSDPGVTIRRPCQAAIAIVAVAVSTGVSDTVNLPKVTLIALLAVALLTVVAIGAFRGAVLTVPPKALSLMVGAFLAAMVLATAFSDSVGRSIAGTYTRWTGLALYAACAVFALAIAANYTAKDAHRLVVAMAAATGLVAVYGFFQRVGLDAINWQTAYGDKVFSSMGNPNFAAAFIGIGVPLWAWLALGKSRPRWLRAGAAGMVLLSLLVQLWTESLQGPLVSVVALWVLTFIWLQTREARARLIGRSALLSVAGLGLIGGVAGYLGRGPLTILDWTTVEIRFWYWTAGLRMLRDQPLTGVGMSGYADYYRRYRDLDAWKAVGTNTGNDAAHNVLIDMLAGGGILVGLAYVAFLAVVTWALVRAVRQARSADVLLVGAVGAAWIGYLAQLQVSIDVPALALMGWMLAGLIFAVANKESSQVVVRASKRKERTLRPLEATLASVLVILTLAGAWTMVRQYRADSRFADSARLAQSDPGRAYGLAMEAVEFAPWEPRYVRAQADILDATGQQEAALEAYEAAAVVNKQWWDSHIASARLSAFLGYLDRSSAWYERVLEIEPVAPEMKVEAARVEFLRNNPSRAVELLEAALEVSSYEADWWLLLAEARAAGGDVAGGDEAFERAVELNPSLADSG